MPDDFPDQPQLISAVKARDLARMHKGMADALKAAGDTGGARLSEQQSQWWMAYAIALSQIPPGATKPEWEG